MSGSSLGSSPARPREKVKETKEVGALRWLKVLLSTFFFTGYFPKCPGTAASAAAFALIVITHLCTRQLIVPFFVAIVAVSIPFIVCLIISIWLSPWALKYFEQSDPKQFVIDEAAGMFLVLVFVPPDFFAFLLAFTLFRIFDILKPWPIKRLEKLPPRFALVADDLMAGIYTIACHLIVVVIFSLLPI